MQRQADQLFGEYFGGDSISLWKPVVDIKEDEKNFLVHADLPGVKKEDIHLELKEGVLSISGERNQEKKEEKDKYQRIERSYGKFTRSFVVPEGITEDTIQAKFDNGVLEVCIPKPPEKKAPEPKKITIN